MFPLAQIVSLSHPFRRRIGPGAAPGSIVVHPDSLPPQLHVISYGPDALTEHDVRDVDELPALLNESAVTWLNVDGLGDAAMIERLGQIFGLHPLALEDVVHTHQRAKVEEYGDRLFIVARMVRLAESLETEQISIFLGKNFVLTFQEPGGDTLEPVRQRIRTSRGRTRFEAADYLAYAILDAIVDGYFPVVEAYGNRLDVLEEHLIERPGSRSIAAIHSIRQGLHSLRRAIWPHRDAINALLRDQHEFFSPETQVYLRDCYDHTFQIIDVLETYRELCADLRDFHYSQLAQRTNEVMRVLTIIATLFMPLSFIAGVYGMNFDPEVSPWNMPELKWRFGYPYALGVLAVVAAGLIAFFWRRGWIGRGK